MSEVQQQLPTDGTAALTERYGSVMMNAFGPPKAVFVRGEGCHLWDADGRKYLDMLSGLAVNGLGHAHPLVLSAITSQLSTLGHVSNFFATPAQIALAERLAGFTGTEARVFFSNSGSEANEAAFKITRLTGRTRIIAAEGSFHGRTMGSLAITHNPKYREPFAPLPGDVTFVPYGDAEALAAELDETVAAVVLEPIQGENGIVTPPAGYLDRARELAHAHGALLWLDEVQTGMGRTGEWLCHRPGGEGWAADLITIAKGLGNGFPVGACLATGPAADLVQPGQHGTTFGGNPVAAIAGMAVIATIERDDLLARARDLGDRLAAEITGWGLPLVSEVRGSGLLRGVVLAEPVAAQIADRALAEGFVINAPRPNVLRLAPPLVLSDAQLDGFLTALQGWLHHIGVPQENS
ncbi:MAG TPA: acetylornithine transaminase [Candidatus Avipropionibacterium avicola]|uniref:Acetylornithine transaminase n=1 Tax=Candidatus Avipropionibacterium avicola TaxID=2840701 RepID=A0A9D1GZZ6_9ACTN|nr:acetylornithine transaminase [Candidatus Avipropionibacterium avicola]